MTDVASDSSVADGSEVAVSPIDHFVHHLEQRTSTLEADGSANDRFELEEVPPAGSDGEGAGRERPTRPPTGLSSTARSRFRSQVTELVHRHPDRPPPGSEAAATVTDRLLVDSPDSPSPLDNVRAQVADLIRPPDSRRGADFETDLAHIDEFLLQVESQSIERQARFERIGGAKNQILIGILMLEWIAFVVWFWLWWLQPEHQVSPMRTAIDASLLLYVSVLLPAMPALYLTRIRRVNPALPVPLIRVAMVVTKAPSEPWDLVKNTLVAMKGQDYPYPYTVWLLDENPSETTLEWCDENDVRVSSRHGVPEYHRPTWPRRTKCKEGNLAYFYDHWGYRDYDVVAQLDADHVPAPDYLESMVRPFVSPQVGYVAAPSICDANAKESWAARGRLYKDALLHGGTQAGCNEGFAPICHGSHYAVRTAALSEIGGIGPELAEDFTTSFLLTAAGWEGAFAIDAEAHGEGPPTFRALLTQEFQWSQSISLVGLRLYFQNVMRLPWKLRIRFGMVLLFYPMLVITTVTGLFLAPIAVVTGVPWMHVNWLAFFGRWVLVSVPLVLATLVLRSKGVLRPQRAKILSWESWLFSFARWPYVFFGFCIAVKELIVPKPRTIKVTPKGDLGLEPLPFRFLTPYFVIAAMTLTAVWARSENPAIRYYVALCLLTGGAYLLVAGAVSILHARQTRIEAHAPWSAAIGTVRTGLIVDTVLVAAWVTTVVIVIPKLF
ncbi:MAG TPA: glycosyltransferase family 2 protein [Acidimicrobiales bacterium]|jgi:cellulose synthase/poly-beta-1,6-N-acetylglucosamine synthase-like glycosyltransferase|nr:glycosyltransferase family 2 protein [Acidimicrobiales bacterium]